MKRSLSAESVWITYRENLYPPAVSCPHHGQIRLFLPGKSQCSSNHVRSLGSANIPKVKKIALGQMASDGFSRLFQRRTVDALRQRELHDEIAGSPPENDWAHRHDPPIGASAVRVGRSNDYPDLDGYPELGQ